jgi:hypothetical protein
MRRILITNLLPLSLIFAIRPPDATYPITTGEVWNHQSNYGSFGGEFGQGLYGLSWPGNDSINNYYLWGSYFIVGAKVEGAYYVTMHNYPMGEWSPSEDSPEYAGPGVSPYDVVVYWDDFYDNPRNAPGRHLGVKVFVRALSWPNDPWDRFIGYVIGITYDSSQCDIGGHGEYLDSLFLGMLYDFDVSGAASEPHIDDLVWFDGWVNGEWLGYPYDSITLLPDSFISIPDGVYDQYTVFGDDTLEHTLHGDTLIIPRNLSYMFDGDNPNIPGDDTGENGMSEGYVGIRLIYAPPAPADSIWVDEFGDTARIPRVWAHQWWNWENDPATDGEMYSYLKGSHPATQFHRYAPLPYEFGLQEFDYKVLQSVGPYRLYHNDTLWFVYAAGVGQQMNGGYDDYWGLGWVRGLRQTLDYALSAYYMGSTSSDPYHPSAPNEDIHWQVPFAVDDGGSNRVFSFHILSSIIRNKIELLYNIPSSSTVEISLYDVTGRRVKGWSHINPSGKGTLHLPLPNLPSGVYFLQIKGKSFKKSFKLVLIK